MFAHFHTGTMTRISPHLDVEQKTGYVTVNPHDAEKLAVKAGDVLVLSSRRGQMEAPANISPAVEPGTQVQNLLLALGCRAIFAAHFSVLSGTNIGQCSAQSGM
jgi:anaerobic selenocysteine-containing dehydrogenase